MNPDPELVPGSGAQGKNKKNEIKIKILLSFFNFSDNTVEC